jgi:hypothetical protein
MSAADTSPAPAETLPEALRHVPALLRAELPDQVPLAEVERTVAATYLELSTGARIASFLPILTEKVARDRLVSVSGRRGKRARTAAA